MIRIKSLLPIETDEVESLRAFSRDVDVLTSGEVKFSILPPDQNSSYRRSLEAVSEGSIEAAFGYTHLLAKTNPSAILFGSPIGGAGVGLDSKAFFSWFYNGGGSRLYDEFWNEMNLNIKGFILQAAGPQAFGWFRSPINSMADFRGTRFRTSSDFSNIIYKDMGVPIIPMKAADILPELEKYNIDAVSWCCPKSDLELGLYKALKHYYLQGINKSILNVDLYINQNVYKSLTEQQRKAIEISAMASLMRHSAYMMYENGKALKELKEDYGVTIHNTPKDYFDAYISAARQMLEEKAKDNDFFAKVWQSQKDFASVVIPYWVEAQTSSSQLQKLFVEENK